MHRLHRNFLGLTGALLLLGIGQGLMGNPSQAAERVVIKLGPFARSVAVADLKQYADTGKAAPELASVLSIVKSEQREALQKNLNRKLPFGVVQVDKLLRSGPGTKILPQVAKVTILPGDNNSEELALRSALIMAAASDSGLSGIGLLEAYPTPVLTIDAKAVQKLLKSNSLFGSFLGSPGPQ